MIIVLSCLKFGQTLKRFGANRDFVPANSETGFFFFPSLTVGGRSFGYQSKYCS